jgi:uncharacterized repeat protein (TIGR01451 family)
VTYDPDCAVGTSTCTAAQLDNGNEVDNIDGLPGTGDEIVLHPVRVAYQHDVSPSSCSSLYFFVPETASTVSMRNFDMDSGGSVLYTRPDGTTAPGSVSGNGVWANDTISVGGSANYGWWKVQFCATPTNLYIFESSAASPLYTALPGVPKLAVTKTDGVTTAEWGQALNYTVNVANTSNLQPNPGSAVGVVVRDTIPAGLTYTGCSMGGAIGSCTQSGGIVTWTLTNSIAAGASVNLGISTTVNWNFSGTVINTAIADYNDVYGNNYPDVTGSDSADAIQPPTFVVTKTSNTGGALVAPGSQVTYSVQIQNPTTSGHTNVTVTDALPAGTTYVPGSTVVTFAGNPVVRTNASGGTLASGVPPTLVTAADDVSLAAGKTMTVTYKVNVTSPVASTTQRYLTNTATVTSTQDTVGTQDSVTDELNRTPILQVVKTGPTSALVGDKVTYDFEVSHAPTSDSSPVSAVTIADDVAGTPTYVSGDDGDGLLELGETWKYSASYTILGSDPRPLVNTVTVGGTDLNGQAIPVAKANHSTAISAVAPSISLTKTTKDSLTAGGTITYLVAATNTGNVTLDNVQISDGLAGATVVGSCDAVTLAPGATTDCTFTYVASQADVDSGSLTNSASVVGTPPSGADDNVTATDAVTLTATGSPAITLTKTPSVKSAALGNVVTYTLTARNTGNVTLSDVTITDSLPGVSFVGDCVPSTLAPDAELTCTAQYTVTRADLEAGSVVNDANVTGTPPEASPVGASASATVVAIGDPAIDVSVTVDRPQYGSFGEVLTFTVVTTNTGNVTLYDTTLVSTLTGASTSACDAVDATLLPGESVTCLVSYTIVLDDLNAPEKALGVVASGHSNVLVSVHAASAARATPVVALAFTGADVVAPTRYAIAFIAAGLLLVLAAARSRRKERDA